MVSRALNFNVRAIWKVQKGKRVLFLFFHFTGMSETETKIQSAIWELVTTEVYYILALQTVTDVSLAQWCTISGFDLAETELRGGGQQE